jgi:hypothetical protein
MVGVMMAYETPNRTLDRLPKVVPAGRFLYHNHIQPTRRLGSRGFRAYLADDVAGMEVCPCGWASDLGPHYRKAAGDE